MSTTETAATTAEQEREVETCCRSPLSMNAAVNSSKPFAPNPQAGAFTAVPRTTWKLNLSAPFFIPNLLPFPSMPESPIIIHAPLPLTPSKLNPLAAVFSPASTTAELSTRNPMAATFSPAPQMQFSALNPPAATLVPAHTYSQTTSLNPQAATFSPGNRYYASTLDPVTLDFSPVHAPSSASDATEVIREAVEQYESASSMTTEASDFKVDAFTREELDFSDKGEGIIVSGLTPVDYTSGSSTCSVASTADDDEYNQQRSLMHQDPDIHHVNWMGQGVMGRTSTPAAVSLTVALTSAKARLVDNENLRDSTVLREAMLTVDPVVFYGDINQVKNLKGEALREAAIGAAAVCYTPFGHWKNDGYGEDDEHPLTDELDISRYIEGTTVINGWLENGAPTRQDFWKDAEEAHNSVMAMRKKAAEERKLFGIGHTPLRSVLTVYGSQLTIATTQLPSCDASGLVTKAARRGSKDTTASPSPLSVEEDDLFKNASWADDLDNEDEVVAVHGDISVHQSLPSLGPIASSKQVLTQCDEQQGLLPVLDMTNYCTETEISTKPAPNFRTVISGTGGVRFQPMVPIPQALKVVSEPEKPIVPLAVLENSPFVHVLEPCSNAELEAEDEDLYCSGSGTTSPDSSSPHGSFVSSPNTSSFHAENLAIVAADETGALRGRSQEEIDEEDDFIYGPALAELEPVEPATSAMFTLPIRTKAAELSPSTILTLPIRTKPAECSKMETFNLPICSKEIAKPARDKTTADYIAESEALMASLRNRLLPMTAETAHSLTAFKREAESESEEEWEENCVACPESCLGHAPAALAILSKYYEAAGYIPRNNFRPDPGVSLRFVFSPTTDTDIFSTINFDEENGPDEEENQPVQEQIELAVEENNEPVHELNELKIEEELVDASPLASPKQVLADPTTSDSPTGTPLDSWDQCPTIVSPLSCKKGRGLSQMRSMASDHTKVVMPKFSLVPASMTSMIRAHAEKLEEIDEEGEDEAENETLSNIGHHFTTTADEDEEVNAKVDLALSMGHVTLKRSPFVESLPTLIPDDGGSEPATPERSPVPSPYKPPASNTPNAMLDKKVQFSVLGVDEDTSSTEELVGITGIGAIFEEDVQDDSSILSGAVVYDSEAVYLQSGVASKSFAVLPDICTDPSSRSFSDDIFTAPSTETTAPTTMEGSKEGSPSASVIAQPAKRRILVAEPFLDRPILMAEPFPDRPVLVAEHFADRRIVQRRKSGWASIKNSLRKPSGGGFTAAADVQFTTIQRRTSSWTKVENKLQKPAPLVVAALEKKKGGFRKALEKVKIAFIKGVKALA
jgi:hypothetical protein